MTSSPAIGFWPTVRLLLGAARRRSVARRRRQRELLQGRQGSTVLPALAMVGAVLFAATAHGLFCWALDSTIRIASYRDAERDGRMLVGRHFVRDAIDPGHQRDAAVRDAARERMHVYGGTVLEHHESLRRQLAQRGASGFVVAESWTAPAGLSSIGTAPPLALLAALAIVVVWFLMMAFQGEGLELDVQRQRHPMWEWLFSHPVLPSAAFFAEMLAPLAANPVFAAAPIFWMITLWWLHGGPGVVAGLVVGTAMGVAASCFSKALEIAAVIRLPPRSRGAAIGILSWVGYSALVIGLYSTAQRGLLVGLVSLVDRLAPILPLAPARWIFGVTADGETSLALAVVTWLALAAGITALSVWISARATDVGITGRIDAGREARPASRASARPARVWDPLLRKELLWFARDRSAVVQAVLIPITMGAVQAFQFGSLAQQAGGSWNWLCGLGVLCGTYMVTILGPRSLTSEGGALWLALTWPRGLEPLLKAKARLWWVIGSVVVLAVLAFALWRFPGDAPQILLVAVGWLIFGRALAEKMVTLVTAPSSSGEPEPVSRGRMFAAQLGTFSFGIGVIMRNWHLAALGVVYSTLTSAAMWQNFRERLPSLFDPDSERLPTPPTLMHSMVAISAMVDGMAIVSVPIVLGFGLEDALKAQAVAYGVAALVTWVAMSSFLYRRGVPAAAVWRWPEAEQSRAPALVDRLRVLGTGASALVAAAGIGMGLGALGLLYESYVFRLPWVAEWVGPVVRRLASDPRDAWWLAVAAVGFAPLAEEYLFRGLLFRTLDREWGGWRAILGSTLFFTLYHPPIGWPLVALVGLALALLFKATGRLWPGVVLHAVYNAVVTLAP